MLVLAGILYNGMGDSIVINPAKWVSSGRLLQLERAVLAKQPRRHLAEKIIVNFIQKSGQRNSAI